MTDHYTLPIRVEAVNAFCTEEAQRYLNACLGQANRTHPISDTTEILAVAREFRVTEYLAARPCPRGLLRKPRGKRIIERFLSAHSTLQERMGGALAALLDSDMEIGPGHSRYEAMVAIEAWAEERLDARSDNVVRFNAWQFQSCLLVTVDGYQEEVVNGLYLGEDINDPEIADSVARLFVRPAQSAHDRLELIEEIEAAVAPMIGEISLEMEDQSVALCLDRARLAEALSGSGHAD